MATDALTFPALSLHSSTPNRAGASAEPQSSASWRVTLSELEPVDATKPCSGRSFASLQSALTK